MLAHSDTRSQAGRRLTCRAVEIDAVPRQREQAEAGPSPGQRVMARKRCTPTKEQLKAFLEAVRDERLSPLWHTIAMTGMRRGEGIGLRWGDVDLEAGRLSVRRALIPSGREVIVSEPKTVKGRRVIALDPGTVEVMKAQAARQLGEQREWDEAWVESGLVFTQENGQALDPAVSITLHTYSHAIPAMQEEAEALIAGLVFAGE